ncbi:MAG TPA: hypothetical protein VMU50_06455 [Polyangia bacterium]|nr:hypothetical protein [Polyangia bacterium]
MRLRAVGAGARPLAAAAAAAIALGHACAGRAPGPAVPKPICSIETTIGADRAPKDRVFPPQYWFVLLVEGYQSSGLIGRPARDCRGFPVSQAGDGCDGQPPVEVAPQPVGARDLVVANLGDARRLVWAITDRLSDGQGQGPVALVEIGAGGVGVRAIGTLRTYPENVALRFERVGTTTVLVAEGEKCAGAGADCERAVRLLPLFGDRFVSKPLVDDRNTCLGSALILVRTKGGLGRRTSTNYELEAALVFGPDAITIREQLAVSGGHGAGEQQNASVGSAFVTRVQAERTLTVRGGALVATGPSLLDRWLAQQGGIKREP